MATQNDAPLRRRRRKGLIFSGGLTLTLVVGSALVSAALNDPRPSQLQSAGSVAKKPDLSAPVISLSWPSAASVNTASWAAGCAPAGLCGTAADATGVSLVQIAVRQDATGRYWDGTGFGVGLTWNRANGTTDWKYGLARPADGSYTVLLRATDTVNNETAAADHVTRTFRVDTVAPGAPTFSRVADDPTFDRNAQFSYASADPTATFRCTLDGSSVPCPSNNTLELNQLQVGTHCITVTAVDPAGNLSAASQRCWTILAKQTFTIAGSIASPALYPGGSQRLDLVLSNPYNFALKVTAVGVDIQNGTIRDGKPNPDCAGRTNLTVAQPFSGSVTVPAGSRRSLSSLGVPEAQWPLLSMLNLPFTNQDGCKSTTFQLTFSGTGEKS